MQRKLSSSRALLFKNTFMLYILQFSTYLLDLIIVPVETRVLSRESFGMIGVAAGIMLYFQIVIDFGFILSATEQVSLHREDKAFLSRLFTSVTICKLGLGVLSGCVLLVLCHVIPAWRGNAAFFMLYFGATAVNALMPDFIYRGLEKMTAITVRAVCIRVFFTAMICVFMRRENDHYLVPLFNLIGNMGAIAAIYVHMMRKLGVHFCKVGLRQIGSNLRRASSFFASRIASSIYTKSNYILLSLIGVGTGISGLYSAADKAITAAQGCCSPISDSLYPYMVKNHDYKLVKKAMLIIMPIIAVGVTVVFIWAEPLCLLVFGPDYAGTAPVLRAMLPIALVILPSYVCGFPMLSSMGITKYANYSILFGSVLHVCNLALLYFTGNLNIVTMGAAVSVTETSILLFRLGAIWFHRDRLKKPSQEM